MMCLTAKGKGTLMREDGLFSWRYRPCVDNSSSCIDDPNNSMTLIMLLMVRFLLPGHYCVPVKSGALIGMRRTPEISYVL